ncbi:MAG: hypothetical protein HY815_05900 [Candidatus Riflebacteria bacterium]|nr:hypothetical protein [Candidatus Riflebacteria bacterium]
MNTSDTWYQIFFPALPWHRFLWFDALIILVVGCLFDRSRPFSWRNLDLVVLGLWSALGDHRLGPLPVTTVLGWLPLFYLVPRLLAAALVPPPPGPPPAPTRLMERLAVAGLVMAIGLALVHPFPRPRSAQTASHLDESALVGVLGARALLEGKLPYGRFLGPADRPRLRCPQGPGTFVALVPAAALFPPGNVFEDYNAAVRLTTVALLVLGFAGCHLLGALLAGREGSAASVFVWSILPHVPGSAYTGWLDNLLPGVLTVWLLVAFIARRWALTGLGLGVLAATTFHPIALLPVFMAAPPPGSPGGRARRGFGGRNERSEGPPMSNDAARLGRGACDADEPRSRLAAAAMLVLGLLFAPVILEPSGPARLMAEEATGAVTGRIPRSAAGGLSAVPGTGDADSVDVPGGEPPRPPMAAGAPGRGGRGVLPAVLAGRPRPTNPLGPAVHPGALARAGTLGAVGGRAAAVTGGPDRPTRWS